MSEFITLDPSRLSARQRDHAGRSHTRLTDHLAVHSADLVRVLNSAAPFTARAIIHIDTPDAREGEVRVTQEAGRFTFERTGDAPGQPEAVTCSRVDVLDQLQLRLGAEGWPEQAALKRARVQNTWASGTVQGTTLEAVRDELTAALPENRELARMLDGGAPAVLFLGDERWGLVFRLGEHVHVRVANDLTDLAPHARALRDLGLWNEDTGG